MWLDTNPAKIEAVSVPARENRDVPDREAIAMALTGGNEKIQVW